jgi:hypothetical protein
MGYWLAEPSIKNPSLIVDGVRELAAAGYTAIRIMLRNTNYTHRCPEVVAAVRTAVEAGAEAGVRIALDCEPHPTPVITDIGRRFPDAIGKRIVRAEARVNGGRFRTVVPVPGTSIWEGVEAAFLQGENGGYRKVALTDLNVDWETEVYRDGDTRGHQDFADGRPGKQRYICRVTGGIPDTLAGTLVFYARFSDRATLDFWAEGTVRYYRELLDCYRGIALGGVGWDEPATGGDWTDYRYGDAFAEAFEQRNGYRLADRLALLDAQGNSADAVRTRLNYYETLNEGLVAAQSALSAHARELFGDDILLGTHHTWQGEGGSNDYRAGAVDYFRLADTQDAGYTDCWWWDQGSVCYAYALGTSLGRLSPSGETEVNTWHAKPTIAQVQYNARLMSLYNLSWFNIWYGDTADTCLLNTHYTWQATKAATKAHDAVQERLVGSSPVVDIAIFHGWETVAGLNNVDVANAHKTFLINTSRLFTERSVAFDFIDTRLLATSKVDEGKLVNALGKYSVLVLPYATIVPKAAWEAVTAFAEAGGRVAFVGPPPTATTEGGDISDHFAKMVGLSSTLTAADYLRSIFSWYQLPKGRSAFLDCYVPLHAHSSRPLVSIENEPHGSADPTGKIVYLTDLDPRERLLDLVTEWAPPTAVCHSDSALWKLYVKDGQPILVVIAKENRKLSGIVSLAGLETRLNGGTVAIVTVVNGALNVETA